MNGFRCSRCGCSISIDEYIQNSHEIKVLGRLTIFHFCNGCLVVIKDDESK